MAKFFSLLLACCLVLGIALWTQFPTVGQNPFGSPTPAERNANETNAPLSAPLSPLQNPLDTAPARLDANTPTTPEIAPQSGSGTPSGVAISPYSSATDLAPAPEFSPRRARREARSLSDPNRIQNCLIKAIDGQDIQVPAQEAGLLVKLDVIEGSEITAAGVLGNLDDMQPRLQKKAAAAEAKAALEKSKSTIDERYAKKAAAVAKAEWDKAIQANIQAPNSVSEVEVLRLKLTYERALLEAERAVEERTLASLTAEAKNVEVEAAQEAMNRRQIISPISGTVVEIGPHRGEWLKPGDIILRVVNLEKLKIEGYVNIDHFAREQLLNRDIEVEIMLTKGQKVRVPAHIIFVSPVIEAGGEYRVKAELLNQRNTQSGEWLLSPGLIADMILPPA
ncbi:MAG: HlyD family efflux transporter periplasmic adaptor subunit [Pirellulales bacterium]|nr:HlyD family efflux transporter periplasmic adaptor subunit [Pirellulales bacterium]